MTDEDRVLELLERLQDSWLEVLPTEELRSRALRLLRVHSLKAADAFQLAARLEGFKVFPGPE